MHYWVGDRKEKKRKKVKPLSGMPTLFIDCDAQLYHAQFCVVKPSPLTSVFFVGVSNQMFPLTKDNFMELESNVQTRFKMLGLDLWLYVLFSTLSILLLSLEFCQRNSPFMTSKFRPSKS